MTEHSERARWVTEQVALWLANDGEYEPVARRLARQGALSELGTAYAELIRRAPRGSAAWQVAQSLAPDDYDRIRWSDVAAELLTE